MMPVFLAGTATVALTQVRCPCAVSRLIQAVSVCLRALLRSRWLYCAEADALVSLCGHLCFAGSNLAFSLGSGFVCLDPNLYLYPTCSLGVFVDCDVRDDPDLFTATRFADSLAIFVSTHVYACLETGFFIWSYLSPSFVLHASSYTQQHSHRRF